jgi:hypothetical protein
MQLVINFGKFLLGIVGSLALLMFVYGGFTWLTSGGESGKIDAGKKILINSVIGVAITFFAWVIVAFVVSTLTAGNPGFKWDATLSCEPLLGLEPPDVDLDRLNAGGGTTGAGGGKKVGEDCAKSLDCEMTLYCNKTTAKCTQKIATANKIPGVNNPAATDVQCRGVELNNNDDLACQSGNCTTDPTGLYCPFQDYCCPSTKVGGGEPCDSNKKCQDQYYCKASVENGTSGKCENKWPTGHVCLEKDVVGRDSDDICANNKCDKNVCVPDVFKGKKGEICTTTDQCENSAGCVGDVTSWQLWESDNSVRCISDSNMFCWEPGNPTSGVGTCQTPLEDDKPCEDAAIGPFTISGRILGTTTGDLNAPCKTGYECRPVSSTILNQDKCQPE